MPRLLKPFAESPLKLLAFDTIYNRGVSLQLLPLSPPGTSASTAILLEEARQRRVSSIAEIESWHHGGLNE